MSNYEEISLESKEKPLQSLILKDQTRTVYSYSSLIIN